MTVNREFWLGNFHEEQIPEWLCPHCKKGFLKPVENGFVYGETASTIKKKNQVTMSIHLNIVFLYFLNVLMKVVKKVSFVVEQVLLLKNTTSG